MTDACIVLTTFSNEETGQRIINALLDDQLAACIQVLPIESYYRWQGKVENESEKLAIIKTTHSRYQAVEDAIISRHDYDVPQIVRVPVEGGLAEYLSWLGESCT